MACKAKDGGKVLRRGETSAEWYKDGKPQYYCYGYIDKITDEPLPECKECRSHVSKAQDDLDEYNRRMQIMNEEKEYPPYLDYPKQYKVQTNADIIRAMSDEELAELIVKHHPMHAWNKQVREIYFSFDDHRKDNPQRAWLDWLQQPSEEAKND